MKDKTETSQIFKHFHAMIRTQFQATIQVLKTDNARDFFNSILSPYLQTSGIVHISSCVDTPQQNGVAERKNRHILEVARSLLFQSNVPKKFWGEAVLTATYLINRMPSRVLKFKSPVKTFLASYPNSHLLSQIPLKIFGCTTFIHIYPHSQGKLDERALKCIFLGYSPNKKGYKSFSPLTKKFYLTMDITFFENKPFYPNSVIQGETTTAHESQNWDWTSLIDSVPSPISYNPVDPLTNPQPTAGSSRPSTPHTTSPASLESLKSPKSSSHESVMYPKHLLLPDEEVRVYTRRQQSQPPAQNQQNQQLNSNSRSPETTQDEAEMSVETVTGGDPESDLPIA